MTPPTVLVADDDRSIRTVLTQALGRSGYQVRCTGNAATLWRWVEDGEGDLVITDVVMPDENGLDLIPRIKRIRPYVEGETFCCTYGDGVADIDIAELVAFHEAAKVTATMTAVQPPGRFGSTVLDGDRIVAFEEKPRGDNAWINGGFFVLEPGIFDVIDGDETLFEREPLERLVEAKQLHAFRHRGFWQPVDTLRDKLVLEDLWQSGKAPWKTWSP